MDSLSSLKQAITNELPENLNIKEYELKLEEKTFNLQIKIYSNFIDFRLIEVMENDIPTIYYNNKFDLKKIVYLLKLNQDIYNNLNEILFLIDIAYNKGKLHLSLNNNNIIIIITLINGFKEIECPIKLNIKKTGINEKYNI